MFVILSEAKNPSFFYYRQIEERFLAPLGMTEIVRISATCLAADVPAPQFAHRLLSPGNFPGWLRPLLTSPSAQIHARAARRPELHIERRFKNLLEQFPLIHGGRRPDAQAASVLQ